MNFTETDLIRSVQAGAETGWQALMDANYEPVFRFAYLLLQDPDEAEDITQETFIRAYNAIDKFDSARNFRPWLFGIASNAARNRKRSIRRYTAVVKRWLGDNAAKYAPGSDELTKSQLEAQALWQAILRLKSNQQSVIYLRFFFEMSVNETAEALGVAPGTVKSRLSRALEQLRALIQAEFPDLDIEG